MQHTTDNSINILIYLLKYYAQLTYSTENISVLYADCKYYFSLEPDLSPVLFLSPTYLWYF